MLVSYLRWQIPFLLAGLFLYALGTVPSLAQSDKFGGKLSYAETESVSEFNPYQRGEPRPASDRLYTLIYNGLVSYDYEREKVLPGLAEDWSVSPEVGPAETITFQLREDAEWHDGESFSPADVAFTYRYVVEVRAGSNLQATKRFASLVEGVSTNESENTVTFDLVESTSQPAQGFTGLWIIPEHKFNDSYLPLEDGTALGREPVGTGPYEFEDRNLDGNITLAPFEAYWDQSPYIQRTEMKRVLDPSTMATGAIGGSTQLIVETPPDQIGRLEQSGEFTLTSYQSLSFNAFAYNNNHPILGDRTVREALTHAVDRQSLLKEWHAGKGRVLGGPLVPGHPYYNSDIQPREHDPAAARRLLEEAGFNNQGADDTRQNSDGDELSFTLVTKKPKAAQSTRRQNVAESYISQLEEVGVDVELVNLQSDQYQRTVFRKKTFDIAWVKWEFDPSYSISGLFLSEENSPGGDNIVNYSNQKVDDLIRSFQQAEDSEARRSLMGRVQEIIHDDLPYTFLYTVDNYASIHYSVIYNRIDPYYFFSYYNEWYIDPALR